MSGRRNEKEERERGKDREMGAREMEERRGGEGERER